MQIPSETLSKLRCGKCFKYLSVGPICVTPSGLSLCGRCVSDDNYPVNDMLVKFLEHFNFSCVYDKNGCKANLQWDEVTEHEAVCSHKDAPGIVPAFPFDTVDSFRCKTCKKYLNVSPITVNTDEDFFCGRCSEEPTSGAKLVRHYAFETALQVISFPCRYQQQGCDRILTWGQILEHEESCAFRPFSCPLSTLGICFWQETVGNLVEHFTNTHEHLYIQESQFSPDLTVEGDEHRLLNFEEKLFVVLTKICLQEKKMWICVRYIGHVGDDAKFQYRVTFTNTDGTEEFASAKRNVTPDNGGLLIKSESASVSVDAMLMMLGNPSKIVCSLGILSKDHFEMITFERLTKCSITDCDYIGTEVNIAKHKKRCVMREVSCKWENCGSVLVFKHIAEHQVVCPERTKFYCYVGKCLFHEEPSLLITHLETEHPMLLINDHMYVHTLLRGNSYRCYLRCFEQAFHCYFMHMESCAIYIGVYLYDDEAVLHKYRFTVELIRNNERMIKVGPVVRGILVEYFPQGVLSFSVEETKRFTENQTITFKLHVIEN